MTQPGQQGFPDYGRLKTEANVLYNSEVNTLLNASVVRGPFFVGNVSHLGVAWNLLSTAGRFIFTFYADSALTQPLTDFVTSGLSNTGFDQSIPVLGPWMTVEVRLVSYPDHFDLTVWNVAGPYSPLGSSPLGNVLISVDSSNVAAGTTVTDFANRTYYGWAQWSATLDSAAAWNHRLQVVQDGGTVTTIEYTSVDTGRRSGLVFLPGALAKITTTNADGVVRGRHVFLHALPGVP